MGGRTYALLGASVALAALLGLPGCMEPPAPAGGYLPHGGVPLGGGYPGGGPAAHVAILVPLTGANADRAAALVNAAKLAFDPPGSPVLDVRDTAGTAAGAAAAATQAIAAGDRIILGPLTAAETAGAAGPARQAHVPVLAFTSDETQAHPGVWVLGLTPRQQVSRLVSAAQARGKSHFGALLPENDFGQAMADALSAATASAGAPAPLIHRYGGGISAMSAAARDASAYAERRGPLDEQIRAAKARHDAEGRKLAADLSRQDIPPPPFDTLLLADTGERLATLTSVLPYYDVGSGDVQIMGPALWAAAGTRGGAALGRAWFAAPDPALRGRFDQDYTAKFNTPAPGLADLAYDAAAIARVTLGGAPGGGDLAASLARPEGFAGVDGLLALHPDGSVMRGLALFELQGGSPVIIDPAPTSVPAPGT